MPPRRSLPTVKQKAVILQPAPQQPNPITAAWNHTVHASTLIFYSAKTSVVS